MDKKYRQYILALFSLLITLGCMLWLYGTEFRYANTEEGRLAAVKDYLPHDENSKMQSQIGLDTSLYVVAWAEVEDRLFIYFRAENMTHENGILHLKRGINGKYRIIEADYNPSKYEAGFYSEILRPKDTDLMLYALAYEHADDIASAEITFRLGFINGLEKQYVTKKYVLTESYLEIRDYIEWVMDLGIPYEEGNMWFLSIDNMRLYDEAGTDITAKYTDNTMETMWHGSKTTAELFMLYVYVGIIGWIGGMITLGFLSQRSDEL